MCPVCRLEGQNAHDAAAGVEHYPHPHSLGNQTVDLWDHGAWRCRVCGLLAPPRGWAVLLRAALLQEGHEEDDITEDVNRCYRG